MDSKLLLNLFQIPAPSRCESEIRKFITSYLEQIGVQYEIDDIGNVYNISNKGKPLLSAHMDTVQDKNDCALASKIRIKNGIIKGYGVIGADDKCGIYIILDLLKNGHSDINFLFTVQEEIGANGSSYFVKNNNIKGTIPYCLVLDRRNSGDIICDNNEYGTLEFERVLEKVGSVFGYSKTTGTFSDADNLSEQVSCANLSVGYYNAHTKSEFVVISELQNALNFVHSIIKNVSETFKAPAKTYSYIKGYGKGFTYSNFDFDSISSNEIYQDPDISSVFNDESCELCRETRYPVKYLNSIGYYVCESCANDIYREIESLDFKEIQYEKYDEYDYLTREELEFFKN